MAFRRACALLSLVAVPGAAQRAPAPPTVQNAMVWGAIFGDHRIAPKTAVYWDYQARRADAGAVWQINLGAVGITRDLSPHWRATAALGWSYAYRYGDFAPRTNLAELRPWVQVTGLRAAGAWTWSDRTRAELRVIAPGSGRPGERRLGAHRGPAPPAGPPSTRHRQ
ncbi:MAG: DUF2490 domain-containing protein [Gemmatimonadaceae bacterium]|nr:DUF2490 domain-containing protein [Gemmatimonadaceae bacterium]